MRKFLGALFEGILEGYRLCRSFGNEDGSLFRRVELPAPHVSTPRGGARPRVETLKSVGRRARVREKVPV